MVVSKLFMVLFFIIASLFVMMLFAVQDTSAMTANNSKVYVQGGGVSYHYGYEGHSEKYSILNGNGETIRAYCGEAAGAYPGEKWSTAEFITNDVIKLAILLDQDRSSSAVASARKTVFGGWSGSATNEYLWTHAIVSAAYAGDYHGITGSDVDWVNDAIYYLRQQISNNTDAWKLAQRYQLYVAKGSGNKQDVLWIENARVSVTIKAIDTNGNSLKNMLPDRSFLVTKNTSGNVRSINLEEYGYTKTKCGTGTNSSTWTNNASLNCPYSNITSDSIIYAVYEPMGFFGKADIIDNATKGSKTTDWRQTKKTEVLSGLECKNTGCSVTYNLSLKGTGSGGTNYRTGTATTSSENPKWLQTSPVVFSVGGSSGTITYNIASVKSSTMLIDVSGGSTEDYANIQLYEQNGTNAQKWQRINNNDGTYTLKNPTSGKLINLSGGNNSNSDGTNIQLYHNDGSCAGKWKEKKDGYKYTFYSSCQNSKNRVIDLSGGLVANSQNIQAYTYNGSDAQKWWLFNIDNQSSTTSEKAVSKGTETLLPGQTKCHHLEFKPYGSSSNTWASPVGVCASAKNITFSGYSKVYLSKNTGTSASTGWKASGSASSNKSTLIIRGCHNGCKVKFEHHIQQTGFQNKSSSSWIVEGEGAGKGTFSNGTDKAVKTTSDVTVMPGETKCSTLTFDNNITYSNGQAVSTASTRACVEAVPEWTLTAIAVDDKGKLISDIKNVTTTVDDGDSVSVTRIDNENYYFKGWKLALTPAETTKANFITKTSGTNYISGSGTSPARVTYNVKSLTANGTVYAIYEKNAFAGRAYVFGGSTSADTGYVGPDSTYNSDNGTKKTVSIEMDCLNSGCDANYEVYLKTLHGLGKTAFSTKNILNIKTSPFSPSKEGELVGYFYEKTLYPGQSSCSYIKFNPHGSLASNVKRTAEACASAKVSTFQGKTNVSGGASYSMTWTNTNKDERVNIDNCDSVNGCTISFSHSMRRTAGIGSTTYQVERESNLVQSTRKVSAGIVKSSTTFNPGSSSSENNKEKSVRKSGELTLYPGMVVCEKLIFKPNNDTTKSVSNVTTKVCVSALGNAQPSDPANPDDPNNPKRDTNGDDTSKALVDIEAKNKNVKVFNTYRHIVYAKPTDKVSFRATYNPNLQYTYHLIPEQIKINGGTVYSNTSTELGTLFGTKNGCSSNVTKCWNNAIGLSSEKFANNDSYYNYAKQYTNGSFSLKTETLSDYSVASNDVGKKLMEYNKLNTGTKKNKKGEPLIASNTSADDRTTPRQVNFGDNSGKNLGNVITSNPQPSAVASVVVPYNYNNKTKVADSPNVKDIFAGENTSINIEYIIEPRKNSWTIDSDAPAGKDRYATKVDNPWWRLEYCVGGGVCENNNTFRIDGKTENQSGETSFSVIDMWNGRMGENSIKKQVNINIPDLNAGTKFCVRSAVYPKDSGPETNIDKNYYDINADSSWGHSVPVCFTVAKRPSLEVLGGNIYSNGKIKTGLSKKVLLSGYANASASSPYLFGSWGELGMISTNVVNGLSSGAGFSTELNNSNIRTSDKITACPLSFANNGCAGTNIVSGSIGSSAVTEKPSTDKSAVLNQFSPENISYISGREITLTPESGSLVNGKYYYVSKNNITVNESNVGKNIYVVKSDGTITINGNIYYASNYSSFVEMSKIVFYAKNIVIGCSVANIDGVLIAEENVVTCNNFEGDFSNQMNQKVKNHINDRSNSYPLRINGAVITNKLVPNRTYGAATGKNSGVPAEIINFDPSLYRWDTERIEGSSDIKTNLEAVQTRELAPRF